MKTTQKVYIQGVFNREKDIVNELIKYGAKNIYALYDNIGSNYYYYIDKKCNIRLTDDVELLKDAGYEMVVLPPPPDILPFLSSNDLEKACKNHGYFVKNKRGHSLFDINKIISLIKLHHSENEVYKHLLEYYEFEDKTPCGLVIERKQ